MAVLEQHTYADGARRAPFYAGWLAAVRRWRLEARTYNELAALSDRELDDLGLVRADLRDVARRAAGN